MLQNIAPERHLGSGLVIAARMAAPGPASVESNDVTDNGSQMNSEAYRSILSAPSHLIREFKREEKEGNESQVSSII